MQNMRREALGALPEVRWPVSFEFPCGDCGGTIFKVKRYTKLGGVIAICQRCHLGQIAKFIEVRSDSLPA